MFVFYDLTASHSQSRLYSLPCINASLFNNVLARKVKLKSKSSCLIITIDAVLLNFHRMLPSLPIVENHLNIWSFCYTKPNLSLNHLPLEAFLSSSNLRRETLVCPLPSSFFATSPG